MMFPFMIKRIPWVLRLETILVLKFSEYLSFSWKPQWTLERKLFPYVYYSYLPLTSLPLLIFYLCTTFYSYQPQVIWVCKACVVTLLDSNVINEFWHIANVMLYLKATSVFSTLLIFSPFLNITLSQQPVCVKLAWIFF
jgi:hypothetical protein